MWARCCAAYERAAEAGPSASSQEEEDVHLERAEAYHRYGEGVQQLARFAGSADEEARLHAQGGRLCEAAAAAYAAVRADPASGAMREDAAVNCANCLATWAEMTPPAEAQRLPERAVELYRTALGRATAAAAGEGEGDAAEGDMEILMNLGDAWLKLAEIFCDTGRAELGERAYRESLDVYLHGSGWADARRGDDLSGLVYNWGCCLLSFGQRSADAATAGAALEEAVAKFSAALDLGAAGQTGPLLGLGEALVAQAERCVDADPARALELARAAHDRGFAAALAVDRYSGDGGVGSAEVHALLGQILARLGREPEARRAFAASAATYRAVLEEPKVQGDLGSFREKCDLVYNYGVAAAQCGQAADAAAALRQALQAGGTSAAEMQSDPDLAGVRGQPWFQELLQP